MSVEDLAGEPGAGHSALDVLLRLAYLGLTNTVALIRLLPVTLVIVFLAVAAVLGCTAFLLRRRTLRRA